MFTFIKYGGIKIKLNANINNIMADKKGKNT